MEDLRGWLFGAVHAGEYRHPHRQFRKRDPEYYVQKWREFIRRRVAGRSGHLEASAFGRRSHVSLFGSAPALQSAVWYFGLVRFLPAGVGARIESVDRR